ncbi:hypothetical protein FRC06_003252 [Ceratobasidium sp. 370]|nr:hypothetical protein FRC06_003252 [Ceratobasidium sp. 370]
MAFILTNIQVCIMEFADGCFQAIELNVTQQYEMYMNHLRGLQAYERRAPVRLMGMQEDWFMYAKAFAGVNDSEDEQEPEQSDLDFLADIPPNLPGPNALELLDETGLPDEPKAAAEPEIPADPLYSEAVVPIDQDDWQLYEPLELRLPDGTCEGKGASWAVTLSPLSPVSSLAAVSSLATISSLTAVSSLAAVSFSALPQVSHHPYVLFLDTALYAPLPLIGSAVVSR